MVTLRISDIYFLAKDLPESRLLLHRVTARGVTRNGETVYTVENQDRRLVVDILRKLWATQRGFLPVDFTPEKDVNGVKVLAFADDTILAYLRTAIELSTKKKPILIQPRPKPSVVVRERVEPGEVDVDDTIRQELVCGYCTAPLDPNHEATRAAIREYERDHGRILYQRVFRCSNVACNARFHDWHIVLTHEITDECPSCGQRVQFREMSL